MITLTFNCSLELAEKLLATVRAYNTVSGAEIVIDAPQAAEADTIMSEHAKKVEQMLISAKGGAKIQILEQVKVSTKLTDYEKDYLCRQ